MDTPSSPVGDITTAIVDCDQCYAPEASLSAITVAIVVLLAILLIYHLVCFGVSAVKRSREGYVSQQAYEVTSQARELFSRSQGGRQPTRNTRLG